MAESPRPAKWGRASYARDWIYGSMGFGSWQNLINITQEAKQMRAEDDAAEVLSCPYHGEPLLENSRGVRRCPEGDYETRRGAPTRI